MRVNSISNVKYNYNNANVSFKHTAVAYPEYEYAQKSDTKNVGFFAKISELFHPEVTKTANEIKSDIDSLYNAQKTSTDNKDVKLINGKSFGKQQLLSVLA